MPPVSGLLQPTLVRLALEKLVPANGPAEKINGFFGPSGSTVAASSSSSVLAMRYRPALTTASPCSSRLVILRSARLMSSYVRIEGASLPGDDSTAAVQCCIVGGGPAGMMLGLLLARAGVNVVVLEKHADFLRDFRGDTIHPSTLEVMHELGLLEAFLALPYTQVRELAGIIGGERIPIAD